LIFKNYLESETIANFYSVKKIISVTKHIRKFWHLIKSKDENKNQVTKTKILKNIFKIENSIEKPIELYKLDFDMCSIEL